MRGGVKLAFVFVAVIGVLIMGVSAAAQTGTDAATPDPDSGSYIVQPGDRLWDIARRFGADMRCLVRVNMLANQNLIRRGQTLDPVCESGWGSCAFAGQPAIHCTTRRPSDQYCGYVWH